MRITILVLALLAISSTAQAAEPPQVAMPSVIPNPNAPGVKINPTIVPQPPALRILSGDQAKQEQMAREGALALNVAMKDEVAAFDHLLGDKFAVVLLATNDPQLRAYIAGGILRMNPDIYTRMESGLASLYVENGKLNGQSRRICYVLNNPDRASYLWRSFVPENDRTQKGTSWASKYLVAHEVGHCLDRWQRQAYTQKGPITQSLLATLGVPEVAFDRAFGHGRAIEAQEYQAQQVVLNRDGALLQYQERIADAFAVLWLMGLHIPNDNLKPIWDTRNRVAANGAYHAHATTPALQKAYAYGMQFKSMPDLQSLWKMARQSQIDAGVDPSLGKGSTLANKDAEIQEAAPGAKPGQISSRGVLPATVRFDRLPKFGAKH